MNQLIAYNCLLLVLVLGATTVSGEDRSTFDDRWDYPSNRAGGIGESWNGQVAFFRSTRRTTDAPEKVILWYAERVGLPSDHALVEAAGRGFATLESRLTIFTNKGHGTKEKKHNVSVLGTITASHAHVTMLYQPSLAHKTDVVISITQTPGQFATNIHVSQQRPPPVAAR